MGRSILISIYDKNLTKEQVLYGNNNNLFNSDPNNFQQGTIFTDGSESANVENRIKQKKDKMIRCIPNTNYEIRTGDNYLRTTIHYYNNDKVWIGWNNRWDASINFKTPANCCYMRVLLSFWDDKDITPQDIKKYDIRLEKVLSGSVAILDNICLTCETSEDIGGNYELDATFLIDDNGLYKNVEEEAILKVKMDYGEEIFRIAKVTTNKRDITVFARQITIADTLSCRLEDVRPTDQNGTSAIDYMLIYSEEYKANKQYARDLEVYSDITKSATAYYEKLSLYQALHDCDQSFQNRWGGEVLRRGYRVSLLNHIGQDRGFQVRSRKNLTGFESSTNIDSIVTRIKPVAFNNLALPNYVDSSLINNYATIKTKTYKYEDIKLYKDAEEGEKGYTLEEAYVELIKRANKEFDVNSVDKLKAEYRVSFAPLEQTEEYKNYAILEKCYLGDTVRVIEEKLGVDISVRAVRKRYNVLLQRTIEIELSNYDLSANKVPTVSDILLQLENIPDQDDTLLKAKENATSLINAGLKDSYVLVRANEILIMNTKDINTAQKIWRFNVNGLGYSSTGYNGNFGLAMTMDGAIVADFITTGVLNANLIKTGILRSFNGSTWINMQNGTFNFADKLMYDGNTMTFKGVLNTKDSNNNNAIKIENRNLDFYDYYNNNRNVAGLSTSVMESDTTKSGLNIANYPNTYLALSYFNPDTGTFKPYVTFDESGILGYRAAIAFARNVAMKGYQIYLGEDNSNQLWSNDNITVFEYPSVANAGISFRERGSNTSDFYYAKDKVYPFWFNKSTYVNGDFYVTGSKHAIIETENYGNRAVDCYEMTESILGDMGEGKIVDGQCVIDIDKILLEMINTDVKYQVFTSVYDGKITSIERYKDHFIVKGEDGTEFGWELKAKRKGYEFNRLEDPESTELKLRR